MKNKMLLWVLSMAFIFAQSAYATDYYFSSVNGNDANNGLSSGAPKASESALQTVLNSLSAGDNVYLERGSIWYDIDLSVSSRNGSSGSHITITSYGTGNLPKLISMKQLGTFTDEGSNIWSITDADLPSNYLNTFSFWSGDGYSYYNDLNFLVIDGVAYAMGKEPNDNSTYYSFETVNADDETSATDNQATWADDYWNGAHMKVGVQDWVIDDVRINDFGSGIYYFNTSDWNAYSGKLSNHNGSYRWIKYYLANHIKTLDQNGEWCYDNTNKKIQVYWTGSLNNSEVYQAYKNYCFQLSGCSYFDISEIEFQGATMNTVKLLSCTDMTITDCAFRNTPHMGLWIDHCTNMTVSNNDLRHGVSNGIYNSHSRNVLIEDNTINDFGCNPSMGGDRDGDNHLGIKDDRRKGTTSIQRNSIDSTGYSGINVTGLYHEVYHATTAPAHLLIDDNDISNFCMTLTDGGAVYIFEDHYTPANTIRSVSGNIVNDGHSNNGFFASNGSLTMGLYVDGRCDSVNVHDNAVYNVANGLNMHGTMNTTFRNNNVYNVGNTESRRAGFTANSTGYGHDGEEDLNARIMSNQFVLVDTISVGGDWYYSEPFDDEGGVCDSNYYYHPFSPDDSIMKKTVSWSPSRITFPQWKSITGFDSNSTYNKNGETYNSGLGITKDQFVKFLINRDHNNSRVVDLHSCTFEDVDGNSVSGSVSVPPRSSKFLFYKTGNADSLALIIPDPEFVPSAPTSYYLSVSYSGTGSGSVSPGSGSYAIDTTITLTATPNVGSVFAGWSGDTTTTTNPLSVVMWKSKSLTATFTDTTSSSEPDTIAYWRFENNAYDETGNHNATLYGSPTYETSPAEGTYNINLDGNGRYANCGSIELGSSFTISGYYKIWGTSGTRPLFATTTSSSPDGIYATVNLSTGVFSLITGNGSSSATATSTTGNHSSGSWVKYEFVVDCDANTCNIYIDDEDESSSTTIVGDFTDNKTFYIGCDASTGTLMWGRADAVMIVGGVEEGDPDPTVTISATDATATEASETTGTIRISRGSETSGDLTVNFSVSGTATISSDYTLSPSNSVTITNGNTYADVTVTAVDDTQDDDDETVILTLSSGSGYSIGSPSSATVTIIDDDDDPTVTITATDNTATEESETTGTFRVSRGAETSGTLVVNFSVSGTATLNTDYTLSSSSSVTIANGNTYADITVTPDDDAVDESDETVILTLSSGSGYIVGSPSSATVTIADNDEAESDTIAYWRFENNAYDEMGNHNATLYGSPTYETSPAEGTYNINLDSNGRYANCGSIELGNSFSISGYYKIWGVSGTRPLFATTTSSSPDGIYATVNLSTGVLSLITGNGSSSATATSTTGNHSSGSWVKYEFIVDCAANTCNIYVDDEDESSSTTIVGDFTDNKTFYIGCDASTSSLMWGRADAVMIVSDGLSRAKIHSEKLVDNDLEAIGYYPIPVTDYLNLKNVPARSLITIYDIVGHKIYEKRNGLGTDLKIDMSAFKSGIFIFRVVEEESAALNTFRVIKR